MSKKKHSPFSASAAHRWVECPASVRMCKDIDGGTSDYAEEGTAAHELAERALRAGNECHHHVGEASRDAAGWHFNEEMAEHAQTYVDYVRALGGNLMIEHRVSYQHIAPDGFGTADAIVVAGRTLHVVDLKYGTGLRVDAQNNPQAMLYAAGAIALMDPFGDQIDTVVLHIVQPRLDHISVWELDMDTLAAFEERASAAAKLALSADPPFAPGAQSCRWCPAQANCQALADHNKETCLAAFSEPYGDFKEQHALSADDLVWALNRSKELTDWVNALQAEAMRRLLNGDEVPGYKVVEGRRLRQWADKREAEEKLLAELGPEAYKPAEIISPAQAEKTLGKKHPLLGSLVETPEGKPTLAPESDKRPPLRQTAQEAFAA